MFMSCVLMTVGHSRVVPERALLFEKGLDFWSQWYKQFHCYSQDGISSDFIVVNAIARFFTQPQASLEGNYSVTILVRNIMVVWSYPMATQPIWYMWANLIFFGSMASTCSVNHVLEPVCVEIQFIASWSCSISVFVRVTKSVWSFHDSLQKHKKREE